MPLLGEHEFAAGKVAPRLGQKDRHLNRESQIAIQILVQTVEVAWRVLQQQRRRTNAEAIGRVLYTKYIYYFQAAGLVLLVAMVGAIVLTLRHKAGVKRQNIAEQTGRKRKDAVELKDVRPGQGI